MLNGVLGSLGIELDEHLEATLPEVRKCDLTNEPAAGATPPAPKRTLRDRLSMPSWALYDFSDTIFSRQHPHILLFPCGS